MIGSTRALDMGCLDPPSRRYALTFTAALLDTLGDELLGAYLHGSAGLGGFVPGRSDIDIMAVCDRPLTEPQARRVLADLSAAARPCPSKGLDFYLVTQAMASNPRRPPSFEVHILTTTDTENVIGVDDTNKPRLTILFVDCRNYGRPILGPDPHRVFAPTPRSWFLDELANEMLETWEVGPVHYRILNACRNWRYLVENQICSKIAGGEWARRQLAEPSMIEAALACQLTGVQEDLDPAEVDAFVGNVVEMLKAAS